MDPLPSADLDRALLDRVRASFAYVREGLVERDSTLYLALVAMVAGEHLLLVGPPGTAKSEVARRLRLILRDARWFERLVTRFTVPEEIFGPLSIRGLQNDLYERLGDGFLPTANVAFLDEIFRANSAILNALLGVLNEREIDNGARRLKIPLACLVAACNTVPDDEDLAALSDRFVLRHELAPVSEGAFAAMLASEPAGDPPDEVRLSPTDLETLRASLRDIELPAWIVEILAAARRRLSERGVYASDRRYKKATKVLRASALLAGRSSVGVADVALLPSCLWHRPEQRAAVEMIVRAELDAILEDEPRRYEAIVATLEKGIAEDASATRQRHDAGGPLFVDAEGYPTNRATTRRHRRDGRGELLFSRPAHSSACRYAWTLDELRREAFAEIADLRIYVSNPENRIMEEVPNEPLIERPSISRDDVGRRIAQLERIEQSLLGFHRGVADACGDLGWAPSPEDSAVVGLAEKARARLDALRDRVRAAREAYATIPTHDLFARIAAGSA